MTSIKILFVIFAFSVPLHYIHAMQKKDIFGALPEQEGRALTPTAAASLRSTVAALGTQSPTDPELEKIHHSLIENFADLQKSEKRNRNKKNEDEERLEAYTERIVENALRARERGEDPAGGTSKEEFKNFDALRYVEIWTARKNMPVFPWRLKELVDAKIKKV